MCYCCKCRHGNNNPFVAERTAVDVEATAANCRFIVHTWGVIKYLCFHFGVFSLASEENNEETEQNAQKWLIIECVNFLSLHNALSLSFSPYCSISLGIPVCLFYLSFRFRIDTTSSHTPTTSAFMKTRGHIAQEYSFCQTVYRFFSSSAQMLVCVNIVPPTVLCCQLPSKCVYAMTHYDMHFRPPVVGRFVWSLILSACSWFVCTVSIRMAGPSVGESRIKYAPLSRLPIFAGEWSLYKAHTKQFTTVSILSTGACDVCDTCYRSFICYYYSIHVYLLWWMNS